METTVPDTFSYFIGGYIFFTVMMTIYVTSLFIRWRSLKQEQAILDGIEN